MNTSTVILGLVLMVVGFLTLWVLCLGGLLFLLGFVVLILGLVQSEPPPRVVYTYGPYGGQYTQYQQPIGPPGTVNFCPYCGQQVVPGALACPRCGRRLIP